jgi:hypothetical protein
MRLAAVRAQFDISTCEMAEFAAVDPRRKS